MLGGYFAGRACLSYKGVEQTPLQAVNKRVLHLDVTGPADRLGAARRRSQVIDRHPA